MEREKFDHYPRPNVPPLDVTNRWHTRGEPGDWQHVCYSGTCPEPSFYYVTAYDAGKLYYMAGPYATHREALELVDKCLRIANEYDGRAWFMSWGTVRTDTGANVGSINKAGLLPDNPPTARKGCDRPTHVEGTNGGTMPCGANLTRLGKTEPYFCAKCDPRN